MVTDEMMKRAIEAYAKDTGAEGFQLEGWIEPAIRAALEAALSAAEPVKTPFEVASKHIPEGRASLLSRAIRQGLNDYGWKNFGTLPEVLMGYIVQAERDEEAAHPQKPRDCGHDGGDLSERRDNIGSAYTRSAQVQDVAGLEVIAKAAQDYVDAVSGEPEKDCWDTEDGKEAPGAVKFVSDFAWRNYDIAKQKAFDNLRALLPAAPAKQEGGE